MSHARRSSKVFKFMLYTRGTAELFSDGVSVWASDADEDFADEMGNDTLVADDIGDALDYLVDAGYMTDAQADDCYIVPEDEDTAESAPKPLEGEYIAANDEDAEL